MNARLSLAPVACLAAATCSGAPPESPLLGLWSRSEAACDMGFGLRFARDAVLLSTPDSTERLLDRVSYWVEPPQDEIAPGRVIVRFRLSAETFGRLVFQAQPEALSGQEAGLRFVLAEQSYQDVRTGSVRIALTPDTGSLGAFARLRPCDQAEQAGLRLAKAPPLAASMARDPG